MAAARTLIAGARRPALVAGIQTRARGAAEVARLADALACPVLTTYKAKGVYPDGGARHAGLFTGARTEAQWLADCDLLILYGVDPIELVASPWPYKMAVLELAEVEIRPHYTTPKASVFGPLPRLAEAVVASARAANWPTSPRPQALPEPALDGLSPHAVARALARAAPAGARLAVDAGAHMLPAMAHWPARAPFGVLISNGISTMGLALPAAIASALEEPERPVVVMTGDGGLAMCLAELATCARERLGVTVVVFNDGALKLIDVKQQQRGFATRGVRYPPLDFARIAEGAGMRGVRVETEAALEAAIEVAFDGLPARSRSGVASAKAGGGATLIDARIDAGGYRAMFEAIRGAP
ncbi:MAG TPA: thiamine pyrophosphate-dependent enzyme, partial [Alphaproteobacteria bacterium]